MGKIFLLILYSYFLISKSGYSCSLILIQKFDHDTQTHTHEGQDRLQYSYSLILILAHTHSHSLILSESCLIWRLPHLMRVLWTYSNVCCFSWSVKKFKKGSNLRKICRKSGVIFCNLDTFSPNSEHFLLYSYSNSYSVKRIVLLMLTHTQHPFLPVYSYSLVSIACLSWAELEYEWGTHEQCPPLTRT